MSESSKRLSLGAKGLIGLAAGLGFGAAIAATRNPVLLSAGNAVELAGKLWINAILMTIVPLVFSKLFVSVAATDDRRGLNRAGKRAALTFIALLVVTAVLAAVLMPLLFARLPIDAEASASLRTGVSTSAGERSKPSEWIMAVVPTNAVKAASDAAMVPLVVFAAAFALGATRIADAQRQTLVQFFQAVDAAISLLLGWIVTLSPYGVFALCVGLAMRVGTGIVSALGYYVLVASIALILCTAGLYLLVALGARISPRRFASACAPAQVVALSTHSSAASLPAMIEGTERLHLPQTATGFVLPLSLAVFKYSSPVWFLGATFFVSRLYDIPVAPSRVIPTVVMAVITSFAVGGVPSGAAVMVGPVLLAAGLPIEAMGLLIAVDPLPNAFRTVANVTGMLAVTALSCGTEARVENSVPVGPRPDELNSIGARVQPGVDQHASGPAARG
ncbi:MAG: dicarboxylate/amino acid:cation symporter [Acidobacteriota bacterium]